MHARLTGICSSDVSSLGAFYAAVLDTSVRGDDVFATVSAPGATLSIYSAAGMAQMAPGSLAGAGSGNLTLEFEVDDVDACHERLLAQAVPTSSHRRRNRGADARYGYETPRATSSTCISLFRRCPTQRRSPPSTSTGSWSSVSFPHVTRCSPTPTSIMHRETGAVLHQAGLVLLRLNESGQLAERRSTYTDLAKPAE